MKHKLKKSEVILKLLGPGVDSSNRLFEFAKMVRYIDDIDYWPCLREAYQDSDFLYRLHPLGNILFQCPYGDPKSMMDRKELNFFNSFPKKFMVYRGMSLEEKRYQEYGVSWTLDESVAEWFAGSKRRDKKPNTTSVVKRKTVLKKDVLGCLNGREEKEILLRPAFSEITTRRDFDWSLSILIKYFTDVNFMSIGEAYSRQRYEKNVNYCWF